jgi:3-oxoacyl-[acyl-carrier-protein] synthase-3
MASKVLLIGSETLSRVIDSFDRDSMIFADGAGACILSYEETGTRQSGILGSCAVTHTGEETDYINMGKSYCQADNNNTLYMKMKGRKVYEYALRYVPAALQECLDRSGVSLQQVKMIFLHQANEKMDEEIVKRLYQLNGITEMPADILPMSIQWLGNSSVATVPTLYHMVLQGNMPDHKLQEGDIVLFASVGAGMSINAVCYRV